MKRNISVFRILAHSYVIAVLVFIATIYSTMAYTLFPQQLSLEGLWNGLQLILITATTGLIYWCFFQTMVTDPGKVPNCWGFFLDDPEHKKRRYCLKCNIFKPERCHHCSACNRCVLNMDHHCPWINNCIGFYNRKYFLLLIFYATVDLFLVICNLFPRVYLILTGEYTQNKIHDIILISATCVLTPLFFVILNFLRFHIHLATENMTTIENLEKQKQLLQETPNTQNNNLDNQFDVGEHVNLEQIFGKNKKLWFIPIFGESGKPIGDGVNWPCRQQNLETLQENQDLDDDQQSQATKSLYKDNPNFQSTLNNKSIFDYSNNNTQQNFTIQNNPTPKSEEFLKFNFSPQNQTNNFNKDNMFNQSINNIIPNKQSQDISNQFNNNNNFNNGNNHYFQTNNTTNPINSTNMSYNNNNYNAHINTQSSSYQNYTQQQQQQQSSSNYMYNGPRQMSEQKKPQI